MKYSGRSCDSSKIRATYSASTARMTNRQKNMLLITTDIVSQPSASLFFTNATIKHIQQIRQTAEAGEHAQGGGPTQRRRGIAKSEYRSPC